MKRKIIIASTLLMYGTSVGQIIPTGGGQGTNSIEYWSRSGNNQNGSNNNIFGTKWNSPIYTVTGGISFAHVRMKLNGDFSSGQYAINGYSAPNVNTTGYMGLGTNSDIGGGQYLWSNMGPFSQLHLNGRNGSSVQQFGYRPWMQTGITLTDNQDLSYIGLRQVGTDFDITETTITWADNASGPGPGPDDMVFRFTSGGGNNSVSTTDLQTSSDLDGMHIARFAGTGEFGLGNTFGINTTLTPNLYVRPASLGHYSLSNFRSVWQQFTNRNTTTGTGTGETASDGLRIGIIGHSNINVNGTAAVYNQETRALLFSTNANTNSINVTNGTTLERMRIMSVGTPTHLSSGGFGVYNPGSIGTNFSRIAISHNPSQPVTRPLSLLHLGYNTGLSSSPLGSTDGWRPWMDIGTFTSNGTDNMYVGLKNEGTDRFDAVVSWGDNQSAGPITPEGPDNLRFIFTSTTSSIINPGDPVSVSTNGLEVARMEPTEDLNGLTNSYGKLGVGDFYTTPLPVTHKLHVRGNGRFEYIPDMDSAGYLIIGQKVTTSNNDLEFRKLGFTGNSTHVLLGDGTWGTGAGGAVNADNGLSIEPTTSNVQLGQEYTPGTLAFGGIGELIHYTEVPLKEYDLVFSSDNFDTPGEGRVSIGLEPFPGDNNTNNNLMASARLNTMNFTEQSGGHFFTLLDPNSTGMTIPDMYCGAKGTVVGRHADKKIFGLYGQGISQTNTTRVDGVRGESFGGGVNVGVSGHTTVGNISATAGEFISREITSGFCVSARSTGVYGKAGGSSTLNVSVYGDAAGSGCTTASNWAGYFNGNVFISGTYGPSDENLKKNIEDYTNANDILSKLRPVSYDFRTDEYPQLNLETQHQIGLLSQEVEKVLPSVVKETRSASKYNEQGELEQESITFKAVSYEKFIPILIGGHKEQQSEIETLKRENEDLKNQVNQLNEKMDILLRCLQDKIPDLCRIEQGIIQQNQGNDEQIRNIIDVELQNGTAIVLNQNVPNPFAESTVITFSIPESVADAQIIFHDATGSLIKSVDIRERGNGQINVYANDLSAGAYTYSLIADGKIVATKRMVKQ